jgi:hypothetical protein
LGGHLLFKVVPVSPAQRHERKLPQREVNDDMRCHGLNGL